MLKKKWDWCFHHTKKKELSKYSPSAFVHGSHIFIQSSKAFSSSFFDALSRIPITALLTSASVRKAGLEASFSLWGKEKNLAEPSQKNNSILFSSQKELALALFSVINPASKKYPKDNSNPLI